jgi:hypothetical protein
MKDFLPLMSCGLMVVILVYIATFWFRAVFALDSLLKYEFDNLPKQWNMDKQPRGMFWKPKVRSNNFLNRLFLSNPGVAFFKFLFTTPQWVKDNPEPTKHIKEIRKFTLFWNIGVVAWFFVLFPSFTIIFASR